MKMVGETFDGKTKAIAFNSHDGEIARHEAWRRLTTEENVNPATIEVLEEE